jgi:hypothetical protein
VIAGVPRHSVRSLSPFVGSPRRFRIAADHKDNETNVVDATVSRSIDANYAASAVPLAEYIGAVCG